MKMAEFDRDEIIRHLKGEIFATNDQVLQDQEVIGQAELNFHTLCTSVKQLQEWVYEQF